MTNTIGLEPVVDKMDRRAALVLGAVAASVLAGGADASAQGAAGAVKSYNPVTVATPLGPYSHAVEVPPNARWLYIAGQIGNALDGSMAADIEGQADQTWKSGLIKFIVGWGDGSRACRNTQPPRYSCSGKQTPSSAPHSSLLCSRPR